MSDVRPGTGLVTRYRVFDKAAELRDRAAAAITANTTQAGVEFPAREQFGYKMVVDYSSTLGTGTSASWSVALEVATAAASGTTATQIGIVTIPAPAASSTGTGTREVYVGGSEVAQKVGSRATVPGPLYVRAIATKTGTDAATLSYGAFLTLAM